MDNTLQSNTSSLSEQKYLTLRKRLDQLGYRQTLGIDSLPLIEKLFNDLVHTTESLKKLKLESNKNIGDTSLLSRSSGGDLNLSTTNIQAYKSDNAKLIKENNELHLELIKIKDENEATIKELKTTLRKLEHENSDLRFLNTQYIHKLRAIEKESKDKSKKILELQEKNFQAVIQTPSGNKQPIPFRRQRLDIDCMLPESTTSSRSNDFKLPNGNDPYLIDMIKLADERILQLQSELEQANQSVEILETKFSNYKNQVESRDKEIERLSRLLDGGRPYDVVSLEAKLRNNDKLISHQNLQIEYLQDKNHQLEKQLSDLADMRRDTVNEKRKNDELVRDLKEINRLAKKAEIDKKVTVQAADRELYEAKYEIHRSREELNTLDSAVHNLNIEKRNLVNDVDGLKYELNNKNNEIDELHAMIQKLQDDKVKLSKRISKLLDNEKELVHELDSVKSGKRSGSASNTKIVNKNGVLVKNGFNLTAKIDAHMKNIEAERDYLKHEVETLNKLLKSMNNSNIPTRLSPSVSPSRRLSRNDNCVVIKEVPSSKRRSVSHSPHRVQRCATCQSSINVINKASKSPSPIRQSPQKSILKSPVNNEELFLVLRERDELKVLLDKFERHMAEIQTNVKVLTNERDKINHLYEETRDELQRTRRELFKSPKTPNVSLAAQTILKRVENERDTALYELRNASNERDTLQERLRISTESAIQEKARLEQQIEDLQILYKNDKNDLFRQIDLLKNELNDFESRCRQQNYQLTQTTQELNDQKSTATQIRMIAEESDRSLDELRRQLAIKNEELNMSQQINLRLEQKLNDLQELNRSLKDELSSLRSTVSLLDKEKDKLLQNVDEKTEENVTLKKELSSKHHRIDELNNQLAQLDAALDKTSDESKNRNKEVTALRIQVDRANEEIGSIARKLDIALRENKRLQEDLITITRENQVLHAELDRANSEKENLREQVQEYINEVTKYDELINQKERDRSNLLDQYREASNEMSKMKMTLNQFETEISNLKIELQMKQAENKRLRERVDGLEKENQQQISICQEYEVKLSNLNRHLQRHEEAIKKYQIENNELMQDVMHLREFNSRLESNKEELNRHIAGREIDAEQLKNLLDDARAEADLLRSQINSERTMVKNLEELISTNREKEFQIQLSTQERDSEIQLLRDRITLNEQKIQTQNKEISTLRTKIVEFETENERVKRQLTNERFERERAAQELRKLTDTVDVSSSRLVRSMSPVKVSFSSSVLNNEYKARSRSRTPENDHYNTLRYLDRLSPSRPT